MENCKTILNLALLALCVGWGFALAAATHEAWIPNDKYIVIETTYSDDHVAEILKKSDYLAYQAFANAKNQSIEWFGEQDRQTQLEFLRSQMETWAEPYRLAMESQNE